ncbi:MAG: hypothetical protein WCX31_04675 [Salinivirgaceae bacterium]|jgi:hypothetical protein
MEKISVNAEFLFKLSSKKEWINRVPDILPEKTTKAEEWIWIDKNGNSMIIGEDFQAAQDMDSYPVKVYRKIRTAEAFKNINQCTH